MRVNNIYSSQMRANNIYSTQTRVNNIVMCMTIFNYLMRNDWDITWTINHGRRS